MTESPRALVIGLGVIGGSIAAGLRGAGWHVTGIDIGPGVTDAAIEREIIDSAEVSGRYSLAFVATPVPAIIEAVNRALTLADVVTDAGSVKQLVVDAVDNPRFVAGHPMAGSERSGIEGANADLYRGATWVLTPTATTEPHAYEMVRHVIALLGAEVVTLPAHEHDEIVASVSHVPHLAASALMTVAIERAHEHAALMRLAAGGFRDMTRIAAGHPDLWTGITISNKEAVVAELGRVIGSLEHFRELIETEDSEHLKKLLGEAAIARRDLPLRVGRPSELAVLRLVVADRPGGLGMVFGVLSDLNVNIEDFNIVHDLTAPLGRLEITVSAVSADRASERLREKGFTVVVEKIS